LMARCDSLFHSAPCWHSVRSRAQMLRAWRLLSAQPSLQRLPRRIGGGPAAVRFLTVSDPGPVRKLDDSSEDNPSAEELGKKRTLMLGRLLKAGEAHKAREMFQALLEDGHAVEHHVTTMLKACATSNEQRALVSRAEEAGVATAVRTYNFLLDSLRIEGRAEEAEEVDALQQEMERRGIEPNEQTAKVPAGDSAAVLSPIPSPDPDPSPYPDPNANPAPNSAPAPNPLPAPAPAPNPHPKPGLCKVLAKPSEELSKQRTAKLGRMLKTGHARQAWELFDGLLDRPQP
jgi:pentatricopeptide repeat protein